MSALTREWSAQYEGLKRQTQSKRISGNMFNPRELAAIHSSLNNLESQLKTIAASPLEHEISVSEIARRQVLVENLKKIVSSAPSTAEPLKLTQATQPRNSGSGGGNVGYTSLSTSESGLVQRQQDVMKLQDEMVLELGVGVGRLHKQALDIGEEAKIHMRLLDNLDSDVEVATAALQAEAQHAEKIRDSTRMCWLYICVALEVLIIIVLLILAFVK